MKITWLGQAGLLFETEKLKIMVDPYLSDSVAKINPRNRRRVPVQEKFLRIRPDVLIFTHNHQDHFDRETASVLLDTDTPIQVLCPQSVWQEARKFGRNHNYILFNRHTQWSTGDMWFTAVKAEHSDAWAIGVIIDDGIKKYYIAGDTLYNTEVLDDIPEGIDVLFLPVNGAGNNMNMTDAVRFADAVRPAKAVPVHWGLFDALDPADFRCENKVIPSIYGVIDL